MTDTLATITAAILALLGALAATFIVCLIGSVVGAFVGWIVGLVFTDTFHVLIAWLGLNYEPWQFGCMLGFISGFFRPTK